MLKTESDFTFVQEEQAAHQGEYVCAELCEIRLAYVGGGIADTVPI
jgi:hypothetical protein